MEDSIFAWRGFYIPFLGFPAKAFKLHKSFLGNEASDFIYRAGGIPLHASLPKERAGLVRPLTAAVYSTEGLRSGDQSIFWLFKRTSSAAVRFL